MLGLKRIENCHLLLHYSVSKQNRQQWSFLGILFNFLVSKCQDHLNTLVWVPKVGKVKSLRCSEVMLGVPVHWQMNRQRLISSLNFSPIPSDMTVLEEYLALLQEGLGGVSLTSVSWRNFSELLKQVRGKQHQAIYAAAHSQIFRSLL